MKLIELHNITVDMRNGILHWLRVFNIGLPNYYIHPDTGVVDVYQNVIIERQLFDTLPIQFGVLCGNFNILSCENLITLKGCPPIVDSAFNCINNKALTSAVGGPQKVGNNAVFRNCLIDTFDGFPKEIGGDLILKDNRIRSFSGIHKHVKIIDGCIDIGYGSSVFEGGMMGVMLIKKLTMIKSTALGDSPTNQAIKIINKHLRDDRSGPSCQLELIDAGLAEYAKL